MACGAVYAAPRTLAPPEHRARCKLMVSNKLRFAAELKNKTRSFCPLPQVMQNSLAVHRQDAYDHVPSCSWQDWLYRYKVLDMRDQDSEHFLLSCA